MFCSLPPPPRGATRSVMLKRLSGGFNTNEPYLVPPSLQQQAPSQSPRSRPLSLPPSPARSAPPSPNNASSNQGSYFPLVPQVDRPTLHRSLGALSSLLVALDEVRDLAQRTAKAHKRVAKVEREIAASFGDKVENGARNDVIGELVVAFRRASVGGESFGEGLQLIVAFRSTSGGSRCECRDV